MPMTERMTSPSRSLRSQAVLCGLVLCCLAGCGSGGGGGGGSTAPPAPTITLSGTATYDRVPTTATGLDYAGTVSKPIRGAVVEVRQSVSPFAVLYRSTTSATGTFTVTAPQNTTVLLNVLAALGNPASPDTRVVDNASVPADDDYAVYQNVVTTTVNTTGLALHAASGWNGTAYDSAAGSRTAAPFAILDTIYDAQQLVRSADASLTFPTLIVGWSTTNSAATTGTSFYSPSTVRLSILGKADEDTDEFDDHVIAHEWGHYYEANFSRSDSLGGSHGTGDILDETVSFGEGFGNAFSGMVTRDRLYRDTSGPSQGTTGLTLDLEADSLSDSATGPGGVILRDGGWSEASIQELLFDLFDGSTALADTDSDGVALGFTPIHQVLTGAQRTTRSFTSIYSFMHHLKAAIPASAADIDALLAAENIGAHDEFEQTAVGRRRFTTVTDDGAVIANDVDGDPITTYVDFGAISASSAGNKLYNRLLFKVTATGTGSLRFRATPTNGTHDVIIRSGGNLTPNGADAVTGGAETLIFNATSGTIYTFGVGSFATTGNATGVVPFTVQCGTSTTVPKPAVGFDAPATLVMPASRG
jgi:hypothetical protein